MNFTQEEIDSVVESAIEPRSIQLNHEARMIVVCACDACRRHARPLLAAFPNYSVSHSICKENALTMLTK